MAVRGAADAGPRTVLLAAYPGGSRGQLLRDRWFRWPVADVHVCELSRCPDLGAAVSSLCRDPEVHGPEVAVYGDDRIPGRVFSGVSREKSAARDLAISDLHRSVLDLEHHPDDLLDSAAWKGRARQFLLAGDRHHPRTARGAALFKLGGGDRLRPSIDDLHGGSDLQFTDADRQADRRSPPRCRRPPPP